MQEIQTISIRPTLKDLDNLRTLKKYFRGNSVIEPNNTEVIRNAMDIAIKFIQGNDKPVGKKLKTATA